MSRLARAEMHLAAAKSRVVSSLRQRQCACGKQSRAGGGACEECRENRDVGQRATSSSAQVPEVPQILHEVMRWPGQPLDSATRDFMEPHFGCDFSRVRVHSDARAAQSAKDINAHAYTVGAEIVFGAGQYAPHTEAGKWLLAHELAHTAQHHVGGPSRLTVVDSAVQERQADVAADAALSQRPVPMLTALKPGSIARKPVQPDEPLTIERNFELDPQLFLKPLNAPAPKEAGKCEEFPGGSTDCEVDEKTGTPTGKVTHHIDETNACTKPCVELHEAVHVKQLKTFCPQLRACYLDADKGKRPSTDCMKMAIFGMKERECEAYKVSVPCMEKRLKSAKECQSKENKDYGARKLTSEKCFRDKNCGDSSGK